MAPRQVKEHWFLVLYKTSVMGLIAAMVGAGLSVLTDFRRDIAVMVERLDGQKVIMGRIENKTADKIKELCVDTSKLYSITQDHDHRIEKLEGK